MNTYHDPLAEAERMTLSAAHLAGRDTERAREIARALLDVRLAHALPDGRPDLAGASHAYRDAVNAMYARTGVEGDALRKLQSRVRYHLGNLVHDYMRREGIDPATYGIHPRGRRAAIRESVRRQRAGMDGADTGDPGAVALQALADAAASMTLAASPDALAALGALDYAERAQASRALAKIRGAAELAYSAL